MMNSKFYKEPSIKNHLCTSGVIVREGKVLLGNRVYNEANVWIAPGGRCDANEKPEDTLLREVAEEIGVTDAMIVRKLGEKDGAYADERGRDRVIVFEVHTQQEPRLVEPEKFRSWEWFGLNELPDNLLDPHDREFFEKAIRAN